MNANDDISLEAIAAAGPGIRWCDGLLELLDQRRLPHTVRYLACRKASGVAEAIRSMAVRGAPAIAIAAAYGMALAANRAEGLCGAAWRDSLGAARDQLAAARPTAVNLSHAVARFDALIERGAPAGEFVDLARRIHAEDIDINRRLAALGRDLIEPGSRVLTHCNTGTLATGGVGTAFGVIVAAWRAGNIAEIGFTETRPWLQGSRLNAWEFDRAGVPATLMTESAAAGRARRGEVDWLIVGADRVARNGDVANKIGTAPLAALTRLGGGRVMVVAPFSTLDPSLASGDGIIIEQRDAAEVWRAASEANMPAGISVANPVFDVTPATDIDRLVTEHCVIGPAQGEQPAHIRQA
ncbi:MAG: S-methyl-5-thioribose-1-phosphate isomerase [Gammaproteobacteria bacterium]|nr:S-methyl-5-thioribose-1-phosphate isomerase [Gammaproteobacteria bacterium]